MNENNVSTHSTYSPSGEIEPGDQSLSDQNRPAESGTLTIAQPHSRQNLRRKSWWAITYRASLVVFPVLAVLTWRQCDFSRQEIPDWKPILALADAAWGRAIAITPSICICKRGSSQSGATIGRGYSPPPVGLNSWKGKGGLIPLLMRFFFALWSQPRKGKVNPGLLR